MADTVTQETRSRIMRAIRAKGMRPEVAVRRLAHRLGYRFRLHRRDLPGTPDLVFPVRRKVIFVHGCFFHGHDCKYGRRKISNDPVYWGPKLARNRERDVAALSALQDSGWSTLVIWECETKDEAALAARLRAFLG